MRQLFLPITWKVSNSVADFVVNECNKYAFEMLNKWPDEIQQRIVCLIGETGSGKTHLANLWADKNKATFLCHSDLFNAVMAISDEQSHNKCYILDDADEIEDKMLIYYIYNTISEKSVFLLMTSKSDPCKWEIDLADIRSRLSTITKVNIQNPTDDAMVYILKKLLNRIGILANEDILSYITNRIERTYDAIHKVIEMLSQSIAYKKHKLNMEIVREIFREQFTKN